MQRAQPKPVKVAAEEQSQLQAEAIQLSDAARLRLAVERRRDPSALPGNKGAVQTAVDKLVSRPCGFEERHFVGVLLIRGYSPPAIDLKFYDAFGRRLERPWLDKLCRKVRRSGKLRIIQEKREAHVLSTGLARKVERVQRLMEYAEAVERIALLQPGKAGIEYRRAIDQIKVEVEGLGIDVTIHPSDAWGELLQQILEQGEARAKLEYPDVGTGTPSTPTPRSEAE